jgi:mannose-6-phosphate isomerase-like protein (cupin superfamily)
MKHDLACTFVVLQPDQRAAPVGDELVCLLSGSVTMVFERAGEEDAIELQRPGEYVLVPKGTWHTARTTIPTNMLFITPGEGTENKPV